MQNEERTDLYLLSTGKIIGSQRMRASNEEHREILDAIARRDPDDAARLAMVHSQLIRRRLSDLFEDTPQPLTQSRSHPPSCAVRVSWMPMAHPF